MLKQLESFIMKTLISLNEPKYDLKKNLKQSNSYFASLSKETTEKILDENTSQVEIFWLAITGATYINSTYNPVIQELLQLPAGKASATLHRYKLLTQETCSHILDNEKPEEINEAISWLLAQKILDASTVDLVLNHPEPKYAVNLIILMCHFGMPLPSALKSLADLEECLSLVYKQQSIDLSRDIIKIEKNLTKLFAILHTCSQITSENIVLFKKHVIQNVLPKKNASIDKKLDKLVRTMSIFQEAGVMDQEQYIYLLEKIQSDTFFNIIFRLDEAAQVISRQNSRPQEKVITVAHIKLIKNAPDMNQLMDAMYGWDTYVYILTVKNFLEIVDHPDPISFIAILSQFQWLHNVHGTQLDCIQYERVKNRINTKFFNQILYSLHGSLNQNNLNMLINYADILFSKDEDNSFWLTLPPGQTSWGVETLKIREQHLDAIFQMCEWINKENITDRSEQIMHLKGAIEDVVEQTDSYFNFFKSSNDSKSQSSQSTPLVENIKEQIEKQKNWLPRNKLLIAFHSDQTHTLRESFKILNIEIEKFSLEEQEIFTPDILDSEDSFKNILAPMIEFAQARKKKNISDSSELSSTLRNP